MLQKLSLLFPLWMILSGLFAMYAPESLASFNQGPLMVAILAFIMLGMGLTLSVEDFRRMARSPRAVVTSQLLSTRSTASAGTYLGREDKRQWAMGGKA